MAMDVSNKWITTREHNHFGYAAIFAMTVIHPYFLLNFNNVSNNET